MSQAEKLKKLYDTARVFTPSAPIDDHNLFAGRTDQALLVLRAVAQKGQHVVMFGERGVGKTSLANVLHYFLVQSSGERYTVAKVNCDSGTQTASLWRNVLRELTLRSSKPAAGFSLEERTEDLTLDTKLAQDKVGPEDIRYVLQRVAEAHIIIILDEVDRIKDKKTLSSLADTIKTLSDNAVPATIILVGVADSVDGLIAEHRSIERALVQVRMPRMSERELAEILDKGSQKLQLKISADARARMCRLSQGLPHYTHLLALHAASSAIESDSPEITPSHVHTAIQQSVKQAQQSIASTYHQATQSPRGNLYAEVLLACALAPVDDLGFFPSVDVRDPLFRVMKKRYEIAAFSRHLTEFCRPEHGPVLQKTGHRRRYRYRFLNPLMQPYIVMKGIADGLINEELWDLS
jgi:Cdc6-like AAA superfamily ATPase